MRSHLVTLFVLAISVLAGCSAPGPGGSESSPGAGPAEEMTPAQTLVARSVAFHDPDGVWGARRLGMFWSGTDADGGLRVAAGLEFGADARDFGLYGTYRGSMMFYQTSPEGWSATVRGKPVDEVSAEDRQRMRLDREDGMFWRGYYGFLAGLPMKITDPGAHLDPEVIDTTFMGRAVQAVRVTYDPGVGGDVWYFYFDPDTAQLVGCRFYHDEGANDGEYLVFQDLEQDGALRLPKRRAWYVNADDRFLGTDTIEWIRLHRWYRPLPRMEP